MIKIKKVGLIVFYWLLTSISASAQNKIDFSPLNDLLKRQIPSLSGRIIFKSIEKQNGQDVFELATRKDKLTISASSVPSAGQGINWYLKYYCHQMITLQSSNLKPIKSLPQINTTERHVSQAEYRYALNYCTFNYSMSFWRWKKWEAALDWMALNGVTTSLAMVGMEQVWYNTLQRLGCTQKEIDDFIPGPSYTAWWLMGNLEGWGGPLPARTRQENVLLQQKIINRMKALGISPELHGFYGIVPSSLQQKFPKAYFSGPKRWVGGFIRPAFLVPSDPLFTVIGDIYYEEMKKLYGSDIRFFGGDPFHEGTPSKDIDLAKSAAGIQQLMQKHYPGSTWCLMGWGQNPYKELLNGLNKQQTIILDLFGETSNVWEQRKSYEGFPFIWNIVSNFGGKEGMYGRLERMIVEPRRAATGQYKSLYKGVGAMPEGILDNPVVYDLLFSMPWLRQNENIHSFMKDYALYRYGSANDDVRKAWEIFLQTTYLSQKEYREGATESVFCARPSLNIKAVSSWGTRKINYDTDLFEKGVTYLLHAAPTFKQVDAYKYDLINAMRQVIANKGQRYHEKMRLAYEAKKAPDFKRAAQDFLNLIILQDNLLKADKRFMLSSWLKEARSMGYDTSSSNLFEKNAKWLITIWGPDSSSTDLHEYSHREWSGLLSTLYYDRWKKYIDQKQAELEGNSQFAKDVDFYAMEKAWANKISKNNEKKTIKDYIGHVKALYNKVISMND